MGLRMQPRSEKFFILISKAGPNVVESTRSEATLGASAPAITRSMPTSAKV